MKKKNWIKAKVSKSTGVTKTGRKEAYGGNISKAFCQFGGGPHEEEEEQVWYFGKGAQLLVDSRGSGGNGGMWWLRSIRSIYHFGEMRASEDYQEIDRNHRAGNLRDTLILCTTELKSWDTPLNE